MFFLYLISKIYIKINIIFLNFLSLYNPFQINQIKAILTHKLKYKKITSFLIVLFNFVKHTSIKKYNINV